VDFDILSVAPHLVAKQAPEAAHEPVHGRLLLADPTLSTQAPQPVRFCALGGIPHLPVLTTDVGESLIESPMPYTNVKRVGHGDSCTVTAAREGNDNSYKMFMEERMQTYKVLKEAVDTM